jgi:DNA-binding response OmpR family regulator
MATAHLIDDDAPTRAYLRRALERAGWTVTESADGRAAVADVGRERPDVVLLDVTMPGPDGWTVLERLRSALGDVRVVMLTGRAAHDDVIRAQRAGADDFIAKPVQASLLLARLDDLLARPRRRHGWLL